MDKGRKLSEIMIIISVSVRIFVSLQPNFQIHNVMMQLVSSHGIVLLEREKPRPASSKNATLYVRRMSQGMKKATPTNNADI